MISHTKGYETFVLHLLKLVPPVYVCISRSTLYGFFTTLDVGEFCEEQLFQFRLNSVKIEKRT